MEIGQQEIHEVLVQKRNLHNNDMKSIQLYNLN